MENGEPLRCHILILTLKVVAVTRHPVLLDVIIQSNGTFVGTRGSTTSTLANRRVQSWHDGATWLIRWG
ncbi:uncharacterized protein F5891DRAFT_937756 [Suillus fuscotomentosus]|uniref:Uncharacterized protein n=1 Tax=Suillus fuscotomentosus TaxID=1912939 RepID=A0AAD4ELH7_9AGAM|nr:uncharacterized protein F5891DRAFT_937756 [Suillus fuscotomentosus]KAG1908394.1 hypothetical protein F5891DRAFT_937756 [Suillus fuscotomentosus]